MDIGCGTGLLALASKPFLGKDGEFTGIDVMEKNIKFCREHYPPANFKFMHFDVKNTSYAPTQKGFKLTLPAKCESSNLVTALSVWTHLNEEDAMFYFNEIYRVLKPDGKAIITFFLLDETYRNSLDIRSRQEGRYHKTSQLRWVFDKSSYGSDAWLYPKWADVPEEAIGIIEIGLDRLVSNSGMKLIDHHQGNWKEIPGIYFQDILIFQKT